MGGQSKEPKPSLITNIPPTFASEPGGTAQSLVIFIFSLLNRYYIPNALLGGWTQNEKTIMSKTDYGESTTLYTI